MENILDHKGTAKPLALFLPLKYLLGQLAEGPGREKAFKDQSFTQNSHNTKPSINLQMMKW